LAVGIATAMARAVIGAVGGLSFNVDPIVSGTESMNTNVINNIDSWSSRDFNCNGISGANIDPIVTASVRNGILAYVKISVLSNRVIHRNTEGVSVTSIPEEVPVAKSNITIVRLVGGQVTNANTAVSSRETRMACANSSRRIANTMPAAGVGAFSLGQGSPNEG